ncbi:MAG TPA: glycosyltransferase family A protein [Chlamydiales bacterium]|nr:glycosyltransferase family A protein [Chlamydiales bacterium]
MKKDQKIEFTIVVPSYNNEVWVERNLHSICSQTYPHFQVVYIDDASTDATFTIATEFVKKGKLQKKVAIVRNTERKGSLANLYATIHTITPEKVVIIVDGDDFLAHNGVLERLAKEYTNKNVWMTYGNFKTEPTILGRHAEKVPEEAFARTFDQWTIHHLISFYAKLFQCIQKEDFLSHGKFFMTSGDIAIDFPLFEMATSKHARFIPDILYIHNLLNPLSDFRAHMTHQLRTGDIIHKKKPYKPLKKLF